MAIKLSWQRLSAMISKEFIQMKRDRATFAMIIGIPLIQIILFGYAINSDPRHLNTALLVHDNSVFTRTFVSSMKNSSYFRFIAQPGSEQAADTLLAKGDVQFVLTIPSNFSHDLLRNQHPRILLQADATDPSATSGAIAAIHQLAQSVFVNDFHGSLVYLKTIKPAVNIDVQAKYNPAGITQYNIVAGLLGVVLTMTMTMITSIAITRERERGTMENLLATPLRPIEVIIGKIIPYILVGYLQISLILVAAKFLFNVPFLGNIVLLYSMALPFIAANLGVGITVSTLAKNQLQAVQMTIFYFLPSLLLSGFMFPFAGMPVWAQILGQVLPLTHFLRIIRGILLKANDFMMLWPNLWPILLFLVFIIMVAVKRYRQTVD
jgi:ABC-2 type transport system permease protein